MFDLTGRTALITGGARGLGAAMAHGLAEFGAEIAIFDVVEEGHEICEEIAEQHGVSAEFYEVDVTSESRIEEAVGEVVDAFGQVHILINNAGIYYPTPVLETSLEDWDHLLRVDLTGYFLMAKHTIPHMPEEGARIINIASIAGHSAFEQSAAYCVAKGGVIELTQSLAYEFGSRGIRVNAICPGTFVTDMTSEQLEDEDFKQTMKNQVPLGRAGEAEEIKGLAVYLASDASSYMSGSIIDLDGGWTCHV